MHIDVDPSSISKRVAVDIPIVGDCATVLRALVERFSVSGHQPIAATDPWWRRIDAWRVEGCLEFPVPDDVIQPQRVLQWLSARPDACE